MNLSPEEAKEAWEFGLTLEREQETLEENLRNLGCCWSGENICSLEQNSFLPGTYSSVEVLLEAGKQLPPIDLKWKYSNILLNLLGLHMRSRAAQLGLELYELELLEQDFKQAQLDQQLKARLTVHNLGNREIIAQPGEGLTNLYSVYGAKLLQGKDLFETLEPGQIEIGGVKGQDWLFIGQDFQPLEDSQAAAIGVALRLKDEVLHVLPADQPLQPFNPEIIDYRQYYSDNNILVPFQADQEPPAFWVGETVSSLRFPQGFTGIVGRITRVENGPKTYHLSSSLLEGGRTDWPIRVEMESLSSRHYGLTESPLAYRLLPDREARNWVAKLSQYYPQPSPLTSPEDRFVFVYFLEDQEKPNC